MTYYLNLKEVFEINNDQDIETFEKALRKIFRVEDDVPCLAMQTASFKNFIFCCRRALLNKTKGGEVCAYLENQYKLESHDDKIFLFRIEKKLAMSDAENILDRNSEVMSGVNKRKFGDD